MKTFIASDFHGTNPVGLVRTLAEEGEIGRVVFLGDYDEPEVLKDVRNLEMDKIVLIGNHDYNLCNGKYLDSKYLRKPLEEYWKIWGDSDVRRFAREGPLKVEEGGVVYLHGSLCDPYCDGEQEVWGRILCDDLGFTRERRVICNFRKMKGAGYWTMFRGHDHFPIVFSTNVNEYVERINQVRSSIDNSVLGKDDMHIVNVGAFVEGQYCVFDDSTLELKFRNVRD